MKKSLSIKLLLIALCWTQVLHANECSQKSPYSDNSSVIQNTKYRIKSFLNGKCLHRVKTTPLTIKSMDKVKLLNFIAPQALELRDTRNTCLKMTKLSFSQRDQKDNTWRPQGVAKVKDIAFISWYHRKKISGALTLQNGNEGMRISIIDLEKLKYQHYKVKDESGKTIIGHADGLAIYENLLFLADYHYGIHILDLQSIDHRKKIISRINSISTENCQFPIYKFGNLSINQKNMTMQFSAYPSKQNILNINSLKIKDLISKERDLSIHSEKRGLPYSKVQGLAQHDHSYYILNQNDHTSSTLTKTDLNTQTTYLLPSGVEDAEIFENELMTVTELDENKSILLIKLLPSI
tara:strand:- start:108629 stop:109681 length:1053 start_codon:yes stop_codon:yes gene_type:complete